MLRLLHGGYEVLLRSQGRVLRSQSTVHHLDGHTFAVNDLVQQRHIRRVLATAMTVALANIKDVVE